MGEGGGGGGGREGGKKRQILTFQITEGIVGIRKLFFLSIETFGLF